MDDTTTLTMTLGAARHAQLEEVAAARGVTVDQVVAHAVDLLLKRQKAARSRSGGSARYGFRWADGVLEPVEAEQAPLVTIQTLAARGCSLRGIADRLNGLGFRTRQGGSWRSESVRRVLGRRRGADDG